MLAMLVTFAVFNAGTDCKEEQFWNMPYMLVCDVTPTNSNCSNMRDCCPTQLAVAFLANKDRLNNAVNSVANNNTAKAPVVVLNDIVQGVGAQ